MPSSLTRCGGERALVDGSVAVFSTSPLRPSARTPATASSVSHTSADRRQAMLRSSYSVFRDYHARTRSTADAIESTRKTGWSTLRRPWRCSRRVVSQHFCSWRVKAENTTLVAK
uniref:Uncharacterized protein n=1 Tax=Plectus sambesii TaxID=2011161 RepID=A0A914UZZ6_9BILA